MRIRKIALQNLNSLRGVHEVDFTTAPLNTAGIIAITGETGAGKSTLLDAILLALFHKTARKHEKEVVTYGQNEAWAELEFEVSGIVYRSRWEVKLKKRGDTQGEQAPAQTSVMQLANEGWQVIGAGKKELKSSKSEAGLIEQIIGLNFDQFCKSVILPQGEFAAFLSASESDRAAILERLTNTEAYGLIGTAAYEKHEEVKLELEQINQRARELQIPTPEELNGLEAEQSEHQSFLTQTEVQIAGLSTQIAWYDTRNTLEIKQASLQEEHARLLGFQNALQSDLQRVRYHHLAKPFLPRIDVLNRLNNDLLDLRHTYAAELDSFATKQALRTSLGQTLEQLSQVQSLANQRVQTLQTLVGPYQTLIERKRIKTEQCLTLKTDTETHKKQIEEQNLALLNARKKQTEDFEKLQKTQEWLERNEAFQFIASDFGALEIELQQLAKSVERIKSLDAQIANFQATTQRNAPALTEKLAFVHQTQTELSTRVEKQQSLLKAEGLERDQLNHAIEELRALQFAYGKIREQHDRYLATLREIDSLREQQEFLLAEEQNLFKELLNLLDEQQVWVGQVRLRKDMFEQQTRIQILAEERAGLKPGEPCSVCGALEHPAAHHQMALVNLAESDYQLAQNRLEEIELRATALQFELQVVQAKLGAQIEQGGQEASTALHQLFAKSNREEQLLGTLIASVSSKRHPLKKNKTEREEVTTVFGQADVALTEVEEALNRHLALRSFLESDAAETDKLRSQIQLAQSEAVQLQADLDGSEQRLQGLVTDQAHYKQEYDTLSATVAQRLEKYAISALNEPMQILEEVQKHMLNWEKGNQIAKDLEISSRELNMTIQQLEDAAKQLLADVQIKEKQLTELNLELVACNSELETTYKNANPASEIEELTAQIKEAQAILSMKTAEHQELGNIIATMQGTAGQRATQIEQQALTIQTQTAQLAQELVEVGVSDLSGVQALVLTDAEVELIQEKQIQIEKDLHACQSQMTETRAHLEKQEHSRPEIAHAVLVESLTSLKKQKDDALLTIGSIRQKFADFEKMKKQAASLQSESEKVRKELNRWERMVKLIGSKDGNNFRKFAQGITLDNLVYHANLHLKRLFGRYKISRVPTSELELEIVDLYQSDHRRSIKSLSGGETFLISLALALGLSDLAGQKARIQSVFIDEGFGSLDGQTLDTAIEALENLQAEGVTIGIISHIPALHERIGTRIAVRKTGNGYSTVEVA